MGNISHWCLVSRADLSTVRSTLESRTVPSTHLVFHLSGHCCFDTEHSATGWMFPAGSPLRATYSICCTKIDSSFIKFLPFFKKKKKQMWDILCVESTVLLYSEQQHLMNVMSLVVGALRNNARAWESPGREPRSWLTFLLE